MSKDIRKDIDSLLSEYRLDEAEEYMKNALSEARETGDTQTELYLLNELAGFYRDKGDNASAIACAESSKEIFSAIGDDLSADYLSAMLNLANAYRAGGRYEDSRRVYDGIFLKIRDTAPHLLSSYYNNIALLCQQEEDFIKAREYLESALETEQKNGDERKIAITRANLSVCMTKTGAPDSAEEQARLSIEYFSGMSPSDFHFSAALAAMGDARAAKAEYAKAEELYEAALSEILLHMGRCGFYDIVSENLALCYEKTHHSPQRPDISGMELSRRYFEAFGKPVLRRNFRDEMNFLACGMCGEGSECFGYDDEQSRDHDFGASFCIFISDDAPEGLKERLEKAYSLLPREFMGTRHSESSNTSGRRGVMTVSGYYKRILGTIPGTAEDFQLIPDEDLACAVNGEVYFDYCGEFSRIRKAILNRPYADALAKLAAQLELMSKNGEYNIERMRKRGDIVAEMLCRGEFIKASMNAYAAASGRLAPYQKWLYRFTEQSFPAFAALIKKCTQGADNYSEIIEAVKDIIISRRVLKEKAPLAVMAEQITDKARRVNIADKIAQLEWQLFDKVHNKGGRASCQDDPQTFFIMRLSQYYTFDEELLWSVYRDFTEAAAQGRNIITEKYGYMMRYTVPDEFEQIKDKLPPVDERRQALIDAIVPIQVGMMEDLAAKEPETAAKARAIHSYEDTEFAASYETYLRGELSTYSEESLALYGAFIVRLYREGRNLAEEIIHSSMA